MSPLFQFELTPVEDVTPWGSDDDRSLNWFALTEGTFRIPVGDHVLLEYSDEILAHWRESGRDASYYLVAFACDILQCVAPGVAPLPPFFANLISEWNNVARLLAVPGEETYTAFRWLGERSPWISYLRAGPEFHFVRTGDDVQIHWDNRQLLIDGIRVWTAVEGSYFLPVDDFLRECRGFADRLLAAMAERIDGIEAGRLRPQIEVDPAFLRGEHDAWRREFAGYFREKPEPDIPWDEAEAAVRALGCPSPP